MSEAVYELEPGLQISLVTPENVNYCWKGCEKYLMKSVKRSKDRDALESIYRQITSGEANLWIVFDDDINIHGCAVTQISSYDTGLKLLMIIHLGGEKMEDWIREGIDILERFATTAGCHGIEAFGRPGFWHWIKDEGWEKQAIVYQKRFN